MMNYDFHALLEPLEFQNLICDIIEARDNFILERFKEGKDGGIDGYCDKNENCVVQAKRYDIFKTLYRDLKVCELEKVKKLNPDRYIIGTSVALSKKEKDEIVKLFHPYIRTTSDILGKDDINNLLHKERFQHIELLYPKLWMTNVSVLSATLKREVRRHLYVESNLELKKAFESARVFVPTRIYRKAAKNCLIIMRSFYRVNRALEKPLWRKCWHWRIFVSVKRSSKENFFGSTRWKTFFLSMMKI